MKKIGFILLLFIGFNLILLSPMIFIGILNIIAEHKEANSGEIREKKAEEYLNKVSDMLERDFNVIIDRNLYKVEYVSMKSNNFYVPQPYVMGKNRGFIAYKSNYLYSIDSKFEKVLITENDASFLTSNEKDYYKETRFSLFFAILDRLGFREYVLNNLLYDEYKGNDFLEIEKIFNSYKKGKIYRKIYRWYNYPGNYLGELEFEDKEGYRHQYTKGNNGLLFYNKILNFKDVDEQDAFLKKYGERLRGYFNKKRKFEEIDWYEFMKYNHLKPRITFIFENAMEDDLKNLRKLIKPYYNEEDVSIILETN